MDGMTAIKVQKITFLIFRKSSLDATGILYKGCKLEV